MSREEMADRWFVNPEMKRLFTEYGRFPSKRLAEFDATASDDEKLRLKQTTK